MSSIRDISGLFEIGAVSVRDAANVATEIGAMLIRDASGPHEVFNNSAGAFDVDVPGSVFGAGAFNGFMSVTTSLATATPSGGQAPYTYFWQRTDGGPATWVITAQASQTTSFRCNGLAPGDSESATFSCRVTDARGVEVTSDEIAATAENYGSLGGGGPIP